MASMLGDTKYYQPAPRAWHRAACIGDRLYMWGGLTEDFSESSRRKLESVVEMYDPYLEAWQQEATTGVPPPGLYAGGCTSVHESLLWYGGQGGESHFGSLHQLNTVTLKWEELHQKCTSEGPMAKCGCGLALFQGSKLGVFGGHGIPTGPTQPGSTFIRHTGFSDGRGWTNELHLYDLQEGVWSSPPTTGSRPPPCSGFTFTAIDHNRGVLFGGVSPEHGKMNEVSIIDVQTMHWTKLDKSGGGPWPVGRSAHAACFLNYGEEHPQLLVSGGLDKDGNTLSDLWVLDVEAGTWKELALPEGTQPRWGHSATAFNLSPGVVEFTMFGGCAKYVCGRDLQQQPKIAETTVVRLESFESSATGGAEWVVKGVTKDRQLGSPERIREKIHVKTAILVSSELAGERENVRKAESEITVESAETQVRVALARAVRAEIRCDRIPHLEHRLQSTQQLLRTKEEELKALTTQYRATHDKLLHTQEQFSTQQQVLSYLQHTADNKQEQLQVRVRENVALHTHSHKLANLVGALQSQIARLEQTMQATQATLAQIPYLEQQLQSKQAQLQSLTEVTQIPKSKASVHQAGLQTGAVGTLHPAELHSQHGELQQRATNLAEKAGYEFDAHRDVMDRQQVPGTSLTGSLRGAEVVAERNFVITNQARSYCWDEFGFRLHVPENSLEAGLSETTVNVRVSLSGHFQLPADSELVSAVYWVFSPHMFSQPLSIEIQHCAALSQRSSLSFVRTKCTQQKLPYQFKEFDGGSFSQQSFYGSISVNHFSAFAIKRRKSKRVSDDYCAQLYKSREGLYDCRFIFAVTRNLEACFSVVEQKYCTNQAEYYTSFTFGFKEKEISLDIPSDGIKLDNGWEIFALSQPMVTKDAADMFSSGKSRIPQCDLMLQWTKNERPTVPLKRKIDIHGATKEYFTLYNAATESGPRPVPGRLPSLSESATSQKDTVFSGSESDTPCSPSAMQSGETTLPTTSISSPLPPLPTHKHLMNEVAMSIPAKWKFMGSELGLQPHQLDAIESDQNGIVALCFSVVFQKWENETTLPYSWSTVITALEAPQVGAVRLAQTLKDRLALVRSR